MKLISKFIKKRSKKTGLPPGTLVHVGEKKIERVKIKIIDYSESTLQEMEAENAEECFPFKDKSTVTWLNITGVHQTDVIEKIGGLFEIHPLVMEDIVNTNQRPKIEAFDDYLFLVLKMLYCDNNNTEIRDEQVSLILGHNFVISFQEREGDVFNSVRGRIRNGKGKIKKSGSDYLVYSLVDAIVDNYFIILEKIGDKIEELGEAVENPDPHTLSRVHKLKWELLFLRKSVWPLRDVVSFLQRDESKLIKKPTKLYIRDVYDHTIQVIDSVETFRDMVSGMIDVYLSSVSNRMNEIMKVLTIFAVIFIPLTFIVGIYGMNFEYMPELKWRWGYRFIWLVIITVGGSMFIYFKRKRWI